MKPNLLVSFSGGETSAFMAQWINANWKDKFESIVYVFANTGEEDEETLNFVYKFSKHFGIEVVWLEASVQDGRSGTKAKEVDYYTASRDGSPFEAVIAKYGIPNNTTPHCTRELKERPIKAFAKNCLGWKDYYTAIGIRADEIDRMSETAKEKRLLYPLVSAMPMSKPAINRYWATMPFRLNLTEWQGNCKTCWKKSLRKLTEIAREDPKRFESFKRWEDKYGNYVPASRAHNPKITLPVRFFRGNRSVSDIIKLSEELGKSLVDGNRVYNEAVQYELDLSGGPCGDESCEVNF